MNYRIDHLAFRTVDRKKCADFFINALGYRFVEEFPIVFDTDDIARCSILEPSNRVAAVLPWTALVPCGQEYVLAPEIFISEGGSIIGDWARKRGGAGLHHIALQVPADSTVQAEMDKWLANGWAEEFSTKDPIVCQELSQVFTKPSAITGVVFELLERMEAGFCRSSVRELMLSTKND